MIETWVYSLVSVFIVTLLSLIGIVTLMMRGKLLDRILFVSISFSAGVLLGGAFLHLLPEIIEQTGYTLSVSFYLLAGIMVFFSLEKFIFWRHCHIHTSKKHLHPVAVTNFIGDAMHNFMDGMIIVGAYLLNVQTGIATTIAVIIHEIPQEIGDFSVLLYSGFSKGKALFFNFLSALAAILGALVALVLGTYIQNIAYFMIPFTAGGFLYIASSDLIPELHKETRPKHSFIQFLSLVAGIVIMWLLILLE